MKIQLRIAINFISSKDNYEERAIIFRIKQIKLSKSFLNLFLIDSKLGWKYQ